MCAASASLVEPLERRWMLDGEIIATASRSPVTVTCFFEVASTPTPTPTAQLSELEVVSINASGSAAIGPVVDGSTLDLSSPQTQLTVEADAAQGALVGSVRWTLDGVPLSTADAAPFAIAEDVGGHAIPWTVGSGDHTLTATPYALPDATGAAGDPLSATIHVTASTTIDQDDPSGSVERLPDRHQQNLDRIKQGPADLLFLGDSITDFWRTTGINVYNANYTQYRPANFGVAADQTQNVIWRITHGELDGILPKVVVLLIGTNNLKTTATDTQIADGIKKIVGVIRQKQPATKVLLLGIFPRETATHPYRARIKDINQQISVLDDGGQHVKYLDIGNAFLQPDGSISTTVMSDLLHPTAKGYQIWADAMRPTLLSML